MHGVPQSDVYGSCLLRLTVPHCISKYLPPFGEICKRFRAHLSMGLSHQSNLVSSIVNYGLQQGHRFSLVGCKFVFYNIVITFAPATSSLVNQFRVLCSIILALEYMSKACIMLISFMIWSVYAIVDPFLVPHASLLSHDNLAKSLQIWPTCLFPLIQTQLFH